MKNKLLVATLSSIISMGCSGPECEVYSEPGRYEIKPCDLFPGPLGVDLVVDDYYHNGEGYYYYEGSYIDSRGEIQFKRDLNKLSNAFFGINIYSK